MRKFITGVFHGTVVVWLIFSLIIGVTWLCNLQPNNIYWIWIILCSATGVTFLLYLLFGENKK